MKLLTWNEKDNPDLPAWQVLADARTVKRRARGASIIGGQEFGEKADHNAIDRAFGRRWSHTPRIQATPLIWNKRRFGLLDMGWVKTHGGVAHVTPHRGFTWGLFKQRWRLRLEPFYVYNTHLISKPYLSAARDAMWDRHLHKMRAHIALKHATGRDIFVVGDFNRKTVPNLHPDQILLTTHWLDHIICIPGANGNRIRVNGKFVVRGVYTDHAPIGVNLGLYRR